LMMTRISSMTGILSMTRISSMTGILIMTRILTRILIFSRIEI
jgi:hypothetical protein